MKNLRKSALAGFAMLTLASCADDSLSGNDVARVSVFNDSPVVVSDVRVTTAEGSTFTVPLIQPGATSAEHVVAALHEYPIVALTVAGKSFIAHPVEGFVSGYNRRLPTGAYTIKVQPRSVEGVVDVTVTQIVPQLR